MISISNLKSVFTCYSFCPSFSLLFLFCVFYHRDFEDGLQRYALRVPFHTYRQDACIHHLLLGISSDCGQYIAAGCGGVLDLKG